MISRDEILRLLEPQDKPAISIFMQTHEAGPAIRKDPIRLKNLVQEAEGRLRNKKQARELLEPAHRLIDAGEEPWRHMKKGLALFLSPREERVMKLPTRVEECLVVGERFYIRPLLSLIDHGQRFYLLTADEESPRLYEGNRESMWLVEDEAVTQSFETIAGKAEVPADVGFHPTGPTPTTGGTPAAKYHAQGEAPEDYRQIELDRYAVHIAKALEQHLSGEQVPLVLAAEPNLLGMLRSHIDYPHLVAESVANSPSGLSEDELYDRALALAKPFLDKPKEDIVDRFGRSDPERASDDPEEVMLAAGDGRVDTLMVTPKGALWGSWDRENRNVQVHKERREDSDDLVERMAAETLRHGGDVYVLDRTQMPNQATAAAVLRY